MQKVYLLLRHNQQTGPYNLQELLQLDLKPFDLIWIEGRSAGWYYPQEIPALQPHLSFLKQSPATPPAAPSGEKPLQSAQAKKIFVSLPSNPIKDELHAKPSFAPLFQYETETPKTPEAPSLRQPEELRTTYAKSLEEVETDFMNWAYQKKPKKKSFVSVKGVTIACLMIGVAFASFILLQPSDEGLLNPLPDQAAYLPEQKALPSDTIAAVVEENETGSIEKKNKRQTRREKPFSSNVEKPMENEKGSSDRSQSEMVPIAGQVRAQEQTTPEIQEDTPAEQEMPSPPVAAESPKEKKKIRDRIADLFKKKPDEKKEEAKPVEEVNGERRSVRRENGTNLAQMMTVKFTIPNDWMLGIKGAKATLTNRSSEVIVKAVVEVVYYNDDNDVLDKRTISFANIKSKQAQTLPVPDHQTATRLEYIVLSATGSGEPFAMK